MGCIGIIGGGAAGVIAALKASECRDNFIYIFEKNPRILKKLLSTGNGRCNITNTCISAEKYGIDRQSAPARILERYPHSAVLNYFESLGLYTYTDASGRVYPRSNQAAGVVDILRHALERENICVLTEHSVSSVKKSGELFNIFTDNGAYTADKVIVACGGPAAPVLGGSSSGFAILSSFGHRITATRPSLVQIKTDNTYPKSLKGIKASARLNICEDGSILSEVCDEVLFTEYGLSGPAALNASKGNFFDDPSRKFYAELDFMSEYSSARALEIVSDLASKGLGCEDLLTGLMHKRLGQAVIKRAGIPLSKNASLLSKADISKIADTAKSFRLDIKGTLGFEHAQVCSGGACPEDFDDNLESRLIDGLFAAGEVLDVDGICGGYNLQWAWASGLTAGGSA